MGLIYKLNFIIGVYRKNIVYIWVVSPVDKGSHCIKKPLLIVMHGDVLGTRLLTHMIEQDCLMLGISISGKGEGATVRLSQ